MKTQGMMTPYWVVKNSFALLFFLFLSFALVGQTKVSKPSRSKGQIAKSIKAFDNDFEKVADVYYTSFIAEATKYSETQTPALASNSPQSTKDKREVKVEATTERLIILFEKGLEKLHMELDKKIAEDYTPEHKAGMVDRIEGSIKNYFAWLEGDYYLKNREKVVGVNTGSIASVK